MQWTLPELMLELQVDPERRVLFVEGTSDLAFWREILPEEERGSVVVYPIGVVRIEGADGERDRLIKCAEEFMVSAFSRRVLFFADADYDRLLGRPTADNVVLTDGRDLESYLLLGGGVRALCLRSADPDQKSRALLAAIDRICRAIASIRLCAERHRLALPFQSTLQQRLSRFVDRRLGSLDADRLIRALLQNSSLGLSQFNRVSGWIAACRAEFDSVDSAQLVHGKDLVSVVSLEMEWGEEEAKVIVSLALNNIARTIASMPALERVRSWARDNGVRFTYPAGVRGADGSRA